MPDDTLLWDPRKRHVETAQLVERPAARSQALVLHRKIEPSFGRACAEVGAELVPAALRQRFPGGACVIWLPIVPSRCLLVAPSGAGFRQIECPRTDTEMARVLERLEVESAWAFEELLRAKPDACALADHLDAALALTLASLDRFSLLDVAQRACAKGSAS